MLRNAQDAGKRLSASRSPRKSRRPRNNALRFQFLSSHFVLEQEIVDKHLGVYPCRVKFMVQLVSHVFPPSAENACSQRQAFGPFTVHMNRLKICTPSKSSCENNSPRGPLNLPTIGTSSLPGLLSATQ